MPDYQMINTSSRELRRLQSIVANLTRQSYGVQSNIMRVYLHITLKSNQYTFERNLNQANNTFMVLELFCILFIPSILKVDYMIKIVYSQEHGPAVFAILLDSVSFVTLLNSVFDHDGNVANTLGIVINHEYFFRDYQRIKE